MCDTECMNIFIAEVIKVNNEIKSIISELEVIYDFYQDKFSLKRVKSYILSMPEGTKIVKVNSGNVTIFDESVVLPVAEFSDETAAVGLLQINHTTVQNRQKSDIADDSKRVAVLVNRLISLVEPKKN